MSNKSLKSLFSVHSLIFIYSISGVLAKIASNQLLFSTRFFALYFFELIILIFFALKWQKLLKFYDVSVLYANRSIALFWALMWSFILFGEQITLSNIIGAFIILIGIVVINYETR